MHAALAAACRLATADRLPVVTAHRVTATTLHALALLATALGLARVLVHDDFFASTRTTASLASLATRIHCGHDFLPCACGTTWATTHVLARRLCCGFVRTMTLDEDALAASGDLALEAAATLRCVLALARVLGSDFMRAVALDANARLATGDLAEVRAHRVLVVAGALALEAAVAASLRATRSRALRATRSTLRRTPSGLRGAPAARALRLPLGLARIRQLHEVSVAVALATLRRERLATRCSRHCALPCPCGSRDDSRRRARASHGPVRFRDRNGFACTGQILVRTANERHCRTTRLLLATSRNLDNCGLLTPATEVAHRIDVAFELLAAHEECGRPSAANRCRKGNRSLLARATESSFRLKRRVHYVTARQSPDRRGRSRSAIPGGNTQCSGLQQPCAAVRRTARAGPAPSSGDRTCAGPCPGACRRSGWSPRPAPTNRRSEHRRSRGDLRSHDRSRPDPSWSSPPCRASSRTDRSTRRSTEAGSPPGRG